MSPNLQQQILRKARDLLYDKRKWTRYGAARTGSGTVCLPYAPEAVKFCAYGAIARAALEVTGSRQQARQLARSIEARLIGRVRVPHAQPRLSHVNDRKGYAAVLKLLDAAVENRSELACEIHAATPTQAFNGKCGAARARGDVANPQGRGRRT